MVASIQNKFDLKNSILYRMVFLIKYHDDKERLIALREQKNKYAKKPYTCDICNVTVMRGNRWLHSKSYRHLENSNKEDKD